MKTYVDLLIKETRYEIKVIEYIIDISKGRT